MAEVWREHGGKADIWPALCGGLDRRLEAVKALTAQDAAEEAQQAKGAEGEPQEA